MHFLITAGGTREYIDPVRFISNASSGRMGCALVRAALRAGHKVTLITAPSSQHVPAGVTLIKVETASEMFQAVKRHFAKCDCLIMAAAVADYAPARPAKTKMKKTANLLTLKLRPTADILKWAGSHKNSGQVVAGFALEDKALKRRAEKKMLEKNLDMIVANTPEAIAAERSTVWIKTACADWTKIENASKQTIARKIIRTIERR
ncbi:MAG: phosphopantothenoylcysteine decarboxylase [Sedimentisphaerales bacterium]|nr:phosphopantothenoylcysteine decarboxylase [Sedimentisphaerales bacterium]